MSNLPDRRRYKRPEGWRPDFGPPWWKDFAATVIFGAIGLGITVLATIENIPIGEWAFRNQ